MHNKQTNGGNIYYRVGTDRATRLYQSSKRFMCRLWNLGLPWKQGNKLWIGNFMKIPMYDLVKKQYQTNRDNILITGFSLRPILLACNKLLFCVLSFSFWRKTRWWEKKKQRCSTNIGIHSISCRNPATSPQKNPRPWVCKLDLFLWSFCDLCGCSF